MTTANLIIPLSAAAALVLGKILEVNCMEGRWVAGDLKLKPVKP